MPQQPECLGRSQPFVKIQPPAIIAQRAPTTSDENYIKGATWIDESSSPSVQYTHLGGGDWDSNNLSLSTDGTFAAASDSTASSSLAIKTYVDATASFGAPIASDSAQGIGWTATDAQAIAGTANDASNAYLLSADNLAAIFGSPNAAIGGTAAVAGTFTDLTADGTGAVSLTSNAAATLTNTAGDITIDSNAGSVIIDGGEAVADAILLDASDAAGGIDVDAGTGGITIDSGDAISIDAAAASNFTTSAGDVTVQASAASVNIIGNEDDAACVFIEADGGTSERIYLHSDQGTGADSIYLQSDVGGVTLESTGLSAANAIDIDATAGGIDMDAAGQINIASSQNAGTAIRINASAGGIDIDAAGAAGEDINIDNAAGSINITAAEAIANALVLSSTNGGIDISAPGAGSGLDIDIVNTGGSVNVSATEAAADAIVVNASAGGLQLLAGGGAGLDTVITNTSGSVGITAGESAADAFVVNASGANGGIQLQAGTGGVLIGNQADCTTIDVGDVAPTAARTITIGGGTVVTASVTDTIDIAPDGATTNADSVKTLNLNTGGVTTGQVLTNIASGAITSGTHTVAIQTGNAAAGTVATNISTGTGTKTVSVGNADAGTTVNIDGVLAVNNNVNAAVTINDGTSTGAVTIGNGAAGAIAVDTGAGISLDAATASNFACAAGDMTIDATSGSLILSGNEDVADCVSIIADNGGIDITCSSASAGQDIDITNTGASINITATESAADAIVIDASGAAGAIQLNSGTGGVVLDSGQTVNVTAVSHTQSAYTVLGSDYVIACETTSAGGGALTLTLPAAPATGRTLVVYDAAGGAAANNITVDGNGNNIAMSGTAAATKPLAAAYSSVVLWYDGTIWLGKYSA